MKFIFALLRILSLCFIFFISCKTATTKKKSTENKSKKDTTIATQSVYPTEPGTCIVQGYILTIFTIDKSNMDEPVAITFIPSIESTINFKICPISEIFCASSITKIEIS